MMSEETNTNTNNATTDNDTETGAKENAYKHAREIDNVVSASVTSQLFTSTELAEQEVRIRITRLNMGRPTNQPYWRFKEFPQPEYLTCKLKSLRQLSSSHNNQTMCAVQSSSATKITQPQPQPQPQPPATCQDRKPQAANGEVNTPLYWPKPEALPEPPKRNQSAYFLYSQEQRPKIMLENPSFRFGDVARTISQRFRNLSVECRNKYNDLALQDKARYVDEMEAYNKKVNEIQIQKEQYQQRMEQYRQRLLKIVQSNKRKQKEYLKECSSPSDNVSVEEESRIDLYPPGVQLKILKYAVEMNMHARRKKMQILIDHYFRSEHPGITLKMLFDEFEGNENGNKQRNTPDADAKDKDQDKKDANGYDFSNKEKIEAYTKSFYDDHGVLELANCYAPRVDEELSNVIQVSFNLLNSVFEHYGCASVSKLTFYDHVGTGIDIHTHASIYEEDVDILMLHIGTDGYAFDAFYDSKTFEFLRCDEAYHYGDLIDPPMEVVLDTMRKQDFGDEREYLEPYLYEEWMAEHEARERSSVTSLWDLDDMKVLRAQIESRA